MMLKFEYCECGCKGHEATKKGINYWIYQTLQDGPKQVILFLGHGFAFGQQLSKHDTFLEAKEAANDHYKQVP